MIGQLISINVSQYEIQFNEKFYVIRIIRKLRNINIISLISDIIYFIPNEFLTKVYERKFLQLINIIIFF